MEALFQLRCKCCLPKCQTQCYYKKGENPMGCKTCTECCEAVVLIQQLCAMLHSPLPVPQGIVQRAQSSRLLTFEPYICREVFSTVVALIPIPLKTEDQRVMEDWFSIFIGWFQSQKFQKKQIGFKLDRCKMQHFFSIAISGGLVLLLYLFNILI